MPKTVVVTGSFQHRNGSPWPGRVRFIPRRLWVLEGRKAYACLAPEVWTDDHAAFTVEVTPTDTDAIMWQYVVICPAGRFKIYVPYDETGHSLTQLIRPVHK